MNHLLYTYFFGAENANSEVIIKEAVTEIPALVFSDISEENYRVTSTCGSAFINEWGDLNVFLVAGKDWLASIGDSSPVELVPTLVVEPEDTRLIDIPVVAPMRKWYEFWK